MPVILAIENDKQQITQLTSIVRGLGAELVLAESAERALKLLAQRVPDLILTPALLLPKDDIALTNRLRELGDAAVHVQMLSIPILATSSAQRRGRLSILRTGKEDSVGCDPDVFSGQLVEYLERAAEEKRTADRSRRAQATMEAAREANGEESAESLLALQPYPPQDFVTEAVDDWSVEAQAADGQRAGADEASRIASERRITEERRAMKAVADAQAAAKAARAANDVRVAQEQRAANAAAEATEAEQRRAAADAAVATAEAARAAAEAKAVAAERSIEQAVRVATAARAAEEGVTSQRISQG